MSRLPKLRTRRRREEGQAMVEFALVIPVLLLLVFGIIQFGILFSNYVTLTDAVRAGSRQAAVSRGLPDPVKATKDRVNQSAAGLKPSDIVTTVTPYDPNGPPGNTDWAQGGDVTVKSTYPYAINLFGVVVMSGNLTSETTERVE